MNRGAGRAASRPDSAPRFAARRIGIRRRGGL